MRTILFIVSSLVMVSCLNIVAYAETDGRGQQRSGYDGPRFSLRSGERGHYWVLDGADQIAIVGPQSASDSDYSLGLFRQYPGQKVPADWLAEPEVLHFVTRYGLGLTTFWMNKAMQGVRPTMTVRMGQVNSFESGADLTSGDVKHIYLDLTPAVRCVTGTAHTGRNSVLFECKNPGAAVTQLTGPELMVTPGRRARISAWVKTDNVSGEGFCMQTGFQRWLPAGPKPVSPLYQSPKLTGTHDWTRLEIPLPLTPADAEFLLGRITLGLKGQGRAWVDDVEFREDP